MENCFTINLGFSLLFWGCRILNVTVTQHQNPEAMRSIPDLYIIVEFLTPSNIKKRFKGFHAYVEIKPQAEASKFSVRQPTPILQPSRNTKMNIIKGATWSRTKPTDTKIHITGQFIALHREVIQLHLTDHTYKTSQILNPGNWPVQSHPQRSGYTANWIQKSLACRKRTQTTAI